MKLNQVTADVTHHPAAVNSYMALGTRRIVCFRVRGPSGSPRQ